MATESRTFVVPAPTANAVIAVVESTAAGVWRRPAMLAGGIHPMVGTIDRIVVEGELAR